MDFDVIDFMGFNNRYKQLNSALPGAEEGIARRIDGIQIRTWEHTGEVDDVLVIYHGGGVNSDAGYDIPARQISQRESVCALSIFGDTASHQVRKATFPILNKSGVMLTR